MSTTPMVPVINPDRGHRRWRKSELYTGPDGTGRYCPNLDDEVWDWATGLWRVVSVDYTTGLSRLQRYEEPLESDSLNDEDILLGVGPGYQSESFRAFIDTSVVPFTLALDSRLSFKGTTVEYVKVFLGSDIGDSANVISAMYDQNGQMLGENIPLELAQVPNNPDGQPAAYNKAVKVPMAAYTMRQLPDNEVLTVVAYDQVGNVRSMARVLVCNSAFARTTDAYRKYITAIHLESPFLSEVDQSLLQFPINLPVSALNAIGVVTYSDNSQTRMAVDGSKFNLYGLNNYMATQQGQRLDLVLTYRLGDDEYCYGATANQGKHISAAYKATTLRMDGAYSVKLFCAPVWVDNIYGYRLRWFLMNLDREEWFEVSHLVSFAVGSAEFRPTDYGVLQNLTVGINMQEVDSQFKNYRHSQTIGIVLRQPDSLVSEDRWAIRYTPGQNPMYGSGVKATSRMENVNNWKLDLSNGLSNYAVWLDQVFYRAEPLFNPAVEQRAPEPTHFALYINGEDFEYPLAMWNHELVSPHAIKSGEPVIIRFFRRTAVTDIQLGMGAMYTKQIS